jgi:hypothetical protein
LEIAHCPVMYAVLKEPKPTPVSPPEIAGCQTVVKSQSSGRDHGDTPQHQLAEPWSGDLEQARILFISSNPSIGENEHFPTLDRTRWSDERVADFFKHRFGGGMVLWTNAAGKPMLRGGAYATGSAAFWTKVRRRAAEILGKEDAAPGREFALTEIVRCKSKRQQGVPSASSVCAKRFLVKTLAASGATLFVVLGKTALEALTTALPWGDPSGYPRLGQLSDATIAGRRRTFLFLGHPSWGHPPSRFAHLSHETQNQVRALFPTVGGSGGQRDV